MFEWCLALGVQPEDHRRLAEAAIDGRNFLVNNEAIITQALAFLQADDLKDLDPCNKQHFGVLQLLATSPAYNEQLKAILTATVTQQLQTTLDGKLAEQNALMDEFKKGNYDVIPQVQAINPLLGTLRKSISQMQILCCAAVRRGDTALASFFVDTFESNFKSHVLVAGQNRFFKSLPFFAEYGNTKAVKTLLELKANVDEGCPILTAATRSHWHQAAVVKMLLLAGANTDVKFKNGMTGLQYLQSNPPSIPDNANKDMMIKLFTDGPEAVTDEELAAWHGEYPELGGVEGGYYWATHL
jgi:hypothetical protein